MKIQLIVTLDSGNEKRVDYDVPKAEHFRDHAEAALNLAMTGMIYHLFGLSNHPRSDT